MKARRYRCVEKLDAAHERHDFDCGKEARAFYEHFDFEPSPPSPVTPKPMAVDEIRRDIER